MNFFPLTIQRPGAMIFALLLALLPAEATTVIPPDFKTMVARAEVIFRGQVTDVRCAWAGEGNQRYIVSYITFDVLKTLKGTAASPYVLKMMGGVVGDKGMEVDGAPKFAKGDVTLLFVEHNGTQIVPLVGMMHGYFRIQADAKTGEEHVLKVDGQTLQSTAEIDREHDRAVATSGTAAPAAVTGTAVPMKRADFEAEIQKQVKGL